jgi:cytochrome c-type biogenesis protein CcmH
MRPGTDAARLASWGAALVVMVGALLVGVLDDSGPRTAEERVRGIASNVGCPVCEGQSVAESEATTARNIRGRINELVAQGELSDAEIQAEVTRRFPDALPLRPESRGLVGLIWVLPIAVLAVAAIGVGYAFYRWRQVEARRGASEADRALVEHALGERRSHAEAVEP